MPGVLNEIRIVLREAEKQAPIHHEGYLRPDAADDELEQFGLPGAWARWWCAASIASNLELYMYDVPGRVLAVGLDDHLGWAVRQHCFPATRRDTGVMSVGRNPSPTAGTRDGLVKASVTGEYNWQTLHVSGRPEQPPLAHLQQIAQLRRGTRT